MTETLAKVDESRSEFEAWHNSTHRWKIVPSMRIEDGYTNNIQASNGWAAWQASRTALAVDITSHTEFEIEHMISPEKEGYSTGWIDGRNYSVEQVRAAGITVKGDSDG